MTVALIDNSILSEYRTCNHVAVDSQKIEFLESILKKFQIRIDRALLTDRLFVEAIGYGKVRREIEKDNKDAFLREKAKLFDCLSKSRNEAEPVVVNYIDFLENLFCFELTARFPQNSIFSMTVDNLTEFRFSGIFRSFNSKLIRYGFRLLKSSEFYSNFISVLVEDSVIRYALDGLNIRSISPKLHDLAFEIIGDITKKLMLKYHHSEVLYTNLNLFGAALKKHIEGKQKHQEALQPLLRVDNDLVDIELSHFPIYGRTSKGETLAVSVITKESEDTVKERLKYNFQAVGTKASIGCPQKLMLGRTLILDFDRFTYQEILTGDYIQKHFKTASGTPIF